MEKKPNKIAENPVEEELSLEQGLEKIEELKDKLQNRDKLISIMAHDVKSSIANISPFLNLIIEEMKEDNVDKERIIENLDIISKSNESAVKLLEKILEFIKFQKDVIKPEILNLDLAKQVEDSISSLLQVAKTKEIDLKNEISNNVNVLADSNMLQMIIRNLASNAIKFTNQNGHVLISSEKKGDMIEIYVADDGVGLTEDNIKNIFKNIGVSKQGTNNEAGTGLGLSFCKDFIEKMNGTIRVESEGKDKGSKFTITLPAGGK